MTLVEVALAYGRGEINETRSKELIRTIPSSSLEWDEEDSYYSGDPQNTLVAVQALSGYMLTLEQVNAFLALVEEVRG